MAQPEAEGSASQSLWKDSVMPTALGDLYSTFPGTEVPGYWHRSLRERAHRELTTWDRRPTTL